MALALRLLLGTGGSMAGSESTLERSSEQFHQPQQSEPSQPCQQSFVPRIGRSISLDHAAELLGVSRRTIYNRIREGRLQTIRTLGGAQRVLLDSITDTRDRTASL